VVIGCWLLVVGYWLLVIGYWLLEQERFYTVPCSAARDFAIAAKGINQPMTSSQD
jgi:hypothetical protein